MLRIFKKIRSIEQDLEEQDKWYYLLQNRLSKITKEYQQLLKNNEEIIKRLEKVEKVIENGKSKSR